MAVGLRGLKNERILGLLVWEGFLEEGTSELEEGQEDRGTGAGLGSTAAGAVALGLTGTWTLTVSSSHPGLSPPSQLRAASLAPRPVTYPILCARSRLDLSFDASRFGFPGGCPPGVHRKALVVSSSTCLGYARGGEL